jgi:hypothetical protein
VDTTAITAYLDSQLDITSWIEVSPLLFGTALYSLTLRVTNFFGLSSSGTVLLLKDSNPYKPLLDIVGQSLVSVIPSSEVVIYTATRFSECGSLDGAVVTYSWSIDGVLQSLVGNPSFLQLAAYSLTAGNIYYVEVTASVPQIGLYGATLTTASMQIQVNSGQVLALTRGGSSRRVGVRIT